MNRELYSFVRHAGLEMASPLPLASYCALLADEIASGRGEAIDIGCGRAALLVRLAEAGWKGRGIDASPMMVGAARELASARGVAGLVRIEEGDAGAIVPALRGTAFDLAICIGATHACGTLGATLARLRRLVRPDGRVLVGELYWRASPPPGLLGALGMEATDLGQLEEMLESGVEVGLAPVSHVAATPEEFEAYEVAQRDTGRAWCDANPEHPDAGAIRARAEEWWGLYEALTREAFGFAACVYRIVGDHEPTR